MAHLHVFHHRNALILPQQIWSENTQGPLHSVR